MYQYKNLKSQQNSPSNKRLLPKFHSMLRLTSIVLGLGICVLASSCAKTAADCGSSTDCTSITYSATIKPIIANKCSLSGCHGSSFSTYSGLLSIVNNGQLESQVVNSTNMPTGSVSMSCEQRQQIECWINNGAANN